MEKQLHPKLRFPDFQGDWESKMIAEVLTIGSGKDYKHLKNGKIPVYGTGGLMTYVDNYIYDGDSVGIGRKGTIDKPVYLSGKFWTVDTLFYTHKFKDCTPRFIFNLFLNINWKLYNEASGVPSLSKATIERIKINLPSLPEQQKISDYFTTIDKKIELLEEKKTELSRYKKAMMQKLFAQEIRFKDENGNDYPEWEILKGGEIFKSHTDKNHNGDLEVLAITQEHGAIPRSMIDYKVQVSNDSVNNYKIVEKDDFIISLRSFQGGIEHSNYVGICSPAYIILRSVKTINPMFYKSFFKTRNYINELNRTLEGIRDGKMISYSNFAKSKIPYPSLPEQQKIADFLSAIDDNITKVEEQIKETQNFKKAMLQQMFV